MKEEIADLKLENLTLREALLDLIIILEAELPSGNQRDKMNRLFIRLRDK